jgi:hypothetical protein
VHQTYTFSTSVFERTSDTSGLLHSIAALLVLQKVTASEATKIDLLLAAARAGSIHGNFLLNLRIQAQT